MRNGDDGDAGAPGGAPADDVGLVAAGAEEIGFEAAQLVGDFANAGEEARRVVRQRLRFEAALLHFAQERLREAAFREGEKRARDIARKMAREAEYLTFGAAEEG